MLNLPRYICICVKLKQKQAKDHEKAIPVTCKSHSHTLTPPYLSTLLLNLHSDPIPGYYCALEMFRRDVQPCCPPLGSLCEVVFSHRAVTSTRSSVFPFQETQSSVFDKVLGYTCSNASGRPHMLFTCHEHHLAFVR